MKDVGVKELENDHPDLLVTSSAEPRHAAQPALVLQFSSGHVLHHVEQFVRDQPLELAERLLLENRANVTFSLGTTLGEDQSPNFLEQGCGLVPELPLQLFPSLGLGELRQLTPRQLQALVHLLV